MSTPTVQARILAHVAEQEAAIRASRNREGRAELTAYGVPWSLRALLGRPPSRSESASYSRALRRLRNTGMVKLTRWENTEIVSNVKITDRGREALET